MQASSRPPPKHPHKRHRLQTPPERDHGGDLRRVGRAHDGGDPLEEVVALGPGGAVAWWVQADLCKLLLDSAAPEDCRGRKGRATQTASETLAKHTRAHPPMVAQKTAEACAANQAGCHWDAHEQRFPMRPDRKLAGTTPRAGTHETCSEGGRCAAAQP